MLQTKSYYKPTVATSQRLLQANSGYKPTVATNQQLLKIQSFQSDPSYLWTVASNQQLLQTELPTENRFKPTAAKSRVATIITVSTNRHQLIDSCYKQLVHSNIHLLQTYYELYTLILDSVFTELFPGPIQSITCNLCVCFCAIAPNPVNVDLRFLVRERIAMIAKLGNHCLWKVWTFFKGFFCGVGVNRLVPQDKYFCLDKPADCA